MYAPKPYRDAVKIQRLLMADMENPETQPAARAQLARAWDVLEDRKRVMKMRPVPKPVDVSVNRIVNLRPALAAPID